MEETDPAERIFLPSAGFSLQETDRWWKKPFNWHGKAQCPDPISVLFTLPYAPRSSPSLTFFFYFLSCLALFPVMNGSAEVNITWIRKLAARQKKQTTYYTEVFSITLNWSVILNTSLDWNDFLSAVCVCPMTMPQCIKPAPRIKAFFRAWAEGYILIFVGIP